MAGAGNFWRSFATEAGAARAQGSDRGGLDRGELDRGGLDRGESGSEAAELDRDTDSTPGGWEYAASGPTSDTASDTTTEAALDTPEVNARESDTTPGKESSRVERAGPSGAGRSRQKSASPSAWPSAVGLLRSSALETGRASSAPTWGWREVAGRLCELAGGPASATLSCAASLALDAQLRGENVAWLQTRGSSFLPQDLHACGIDLDALVVVRVPRSTDLGLAAEWIARSGAFGLVVLDLTNAARTTMAMQARLLALAKKHDLALVCLTEKSPQHASLSSLVSLRVDTTVRRPAPARSTQQLPHAALHESSSPFAPSFGQERAAPANPTAGALATDCVERPRHTASCTRDGAGCCPDDGEFGRERNGARADESANSPTNIKAEIGAEIGADIGADIRADIRAETKAAPPAAPQATGGVFEEAARRTCGARHDLATFECEWFVAKDKRRSRPWRQIEARRGPPGLR